VLVVWQLVVEKIVFFSEIDSPEIIYTLDWIFKMLNLKAKRLLSLRSSQSVDFYYGNNKDIKSNVIVQHNKNDIVLDKSLLTIADDTTVSHFDLINAIKKLILDEVNETLAQDKLDSMHRLSAFDSFQGQQGLIALPFVNRYLIMLRQLIENGLDFEAPQFWPEGKECAVLLTHDVDNPLGRSVFAKVPEMIRKTKSPIFYIQTLFRILNNIIDNNYMEFSNIMDLEEKYNVKSSFNFSTVASWHSGLWRDVLYDIQEPKFIDVLREIASRGWEIGLHASLKSSESKNALKREKLILEQLSKKVVNGIRHHYWHLGKNQNFTLQMHADLGFLYDSTIGFKDAMGFRRSLALPFFPWNSNRFAMIHTLQLPVFCMDGHLFSERFNLQQKIKEFMIAFRRIKQLEGLAVLNWHVRSSSERPIRFRKWAKGYQKIISQLSQIPEVWIPTPQTLAKYTIKKWRGCGVISE
jgi:peptidoglycan/xylan/chitin deacetylase (PgdA/CDA1 family)